ncbi:MAG: hypothetical protein HQM08_16535 [Candidatus Riflebacteria bacterium]|nr:hypothetical protein [Candidatus Riflebacteria bacterium]
MSIFIQKTAVSTKTTLLIGVIFALTIASAGYTANLPDQVKLYESFYSGKSAFDAHDYPEAINIFRKLTQLQSKIPIEVYYYFGMSELNSQDWETSKELLSNYVTNAGKGGQFYQMALQGLSEAQKHNSIFQACGKEWRVGGRNFSWYEAEVWICTLGGGWRSPTREELKELYNNVGKNSPIKDEWVWAEPKSTTSAWNFHFYSGDENWYSNYFRSSRNRAVAVRSGK